ncbi:hypothetical protein TNCV_3569341 [Trichonephila clavipes]|nr:hypothetical protein TNCV_3569341 [Trichonephila clavipes]
MKAETGSEPASVNQLVVHSLRCPRRDTAVGLVLGMLLSGLPVESYSPDVVVLYSWCALGGFHSVCPATENEVSMSCSGIAAHSSYTAPIEAPETLLVVGTSCRRHLPWKDPAHAR